MADLRCLEIHDRREYESALAEAADCIAYENLLQQAYANVEPWYLPAICQACNNPVGLLADKQYSFDGRVNFRERLVCPVCQLNTRQRFMASLVRKAMRGLERPQIYLHEQVTAFFRWAQGLDADVQGSEYLGHDVPGGTVVNGIRHEDAMALSFADASLDVIVSQEVMEHIPEIDPALEEAARVLRAGRKLFFSVPFTNAPDITVKRATLRDGDVVNLEEPVFHGNPVSSEGSLVFYDHGWDLLDRVRAAGFADVAMLGAWSALYGYLNAGLVTVFTATRCG